MNQEERIYMQYLEEDRANRRRWWSASYNELEDVIDAKRRRIAAQRRANEKRWFCEVPNCESLAIREHAPICQVHNRRMHELTAYSEGVE